VSRPAGVGAPARAGTWGWPRRGGGPGPTTPPLPGAVPGTLPGTGYRTLNYRRWVPASFAIAAASLLGLPNGLGYDPWSWLVWGRELDHGALVTAGAASSVKPLPMFADVLLAPFGGAAADLWLVCARAGVAISVVLAYHLARVLAGRTAGVTAGAGWLTASQVAGYLTFEGMSEPLCAAFVLAAVDAHLGGRRWRAAALGVAGALVRIELAPFVAIYGALVLLKQSRRPKRAAVLLAAMLVVVPAAWLLPDAISSGDVFRSAVRATYQSQGGPLLSRVPGLSELADAAGMLVWPLVVGFVADTVASLVAWVRHRQVRPTLPLAALAWGWVAVEAVMVQLRVDTGAPRYLLPGVALAAVVAGCAWSRALRALPRLVPKAKPALLVAMAWLVLAAAPANALVERTRAERSSWVSARTVEHLASELPAAVSALGGRRLVLSCGTVAAAPLQNPVVAWQLDVPLGQVGISPAARGVVLSVAGQPPIPEQYRGDYRTVGVLGPPSWRWVAMTTCPPPGR